MTAYVDTSVLISIVAQDAHTPRARAWFAERPQVLVSTWTLAEVSSVLAIKVRHGVLNATDAERAERQIAAMTSDPLSLETVVPDDVIQARGLVRSSSNLGAPDALHLAISMRLGLPMATFDDNLVEAAVTVGHPVVEL